MRSCLVTILICSSAALAQEPATRPEYRQRVRYQERVASLGPIRLDDPRDLQRCVDLVRTQIAGDARILPFDMRASVVDGRPTIDGYALFPEQTGPIIEILRAAGANDLDNRIDSGPVPEGPRYGLVTAERARICSRPDTRSEQVTQLSRGDHVFLLRQRDEYFQCLGPDGYAGYIATSDIERIDEARLTKILNGKAPATEKVESIMATAKSMLGTKYVWGGTTAAGIDCSGLVQTSFKTIGVNLPRDADQQVLVGKLVATRWHRDALRAGDVLFFLGRRGTISHVGIYLGDDKFIEAADEQVQISSLNPDDPNYRQRREFTFCFGKRVIE